MNSFVCRTCGEVHKGLPFSYAAEYPVYWPEYSDAEDSFLKEDICVIGGEHCYLRATIAIPVLGAKQEFTWIVWVSVSPENFSRYVGQSGKRTRAAHSPYFGWLSTMLPTYPDTLLLKTRVHLGSARQLPEVELEPTDHPLAVEQREGITMERVQAIWESIAHH